MTAVAEPTKKAKKKAAVSDSTIAAAARLHDDSLGDLSDAQVVEELDRRDGRNKPPPAAKPGESGYDWSTQYPGEKVFTYTHDGVSVGLAAISPKRQPSIGFLRKTRKQPEFEQVLDMVEFIASEKALDIINEWVPTDLLSMFEEWSEWNRTNAGE